ncbi:MAG: homocysteine S-methyltransferase family protein [Proteobacteria bacterium]|jgi:methionine synthase I (cobalamin-dependent)|nr:homocysteine S-methyltransferase family protein [Pseudomonadota bacterium]
MPGRDARRGFREALGAAVSDGRPLILDGAVGTRLDDRGADTGAPLWSGRAPLEHTALLESIHAEHAAAGADLLTTCTFRTTRWTFASAGRPDGRWRDAARAAVEIARRAAEPTGAFVVGSIGPLEDCFRPDLAPESREAEREHFALAAVLVEAGVDALLLETFPSAAEVLAAARAAARAGEREKVPFVTSVVTRANGDLLSGEPLAETARALVGGGAIAVGINCVPPAFVDVALDVLLEENAAPVSVYANLGRAEERQGWAGDAYMNPDEYAALAQGWVKRGVSIIGSCCGSTPAHTAAIVAALSRR